MTRSSREWFGGRLWLPPETLILDLEPRFRCRECDAKGTAVVMVKVDLVQHLARGTQVAASSEPMITEAERRFTCRIKLGVPVGGLGARLIEMHAWRLTIIAAPMVGR
jgi:hypothetical protein